MSTYNRKRLGCARAHEIGFAVTVAASILLAFPTGGLAQVEQTEYDEPDPVEPAQEAVPNSVEPVQQDESSLPEVPPLTRFEARIELERLLIDEQFETALTVGATMVELTEQEFGPQSREAAEANHVLAEAQRRAGEHVAAESSYLRSIDLYRANDGPFAETLIEPTTDLGDNYYEDEEYLNAVGAYDEARTIQRRIFGLLSEQQIGLLDKLSATYQQMGMGVEANDQQLRALMLIQRSFPPESIEVLDAIYRYARWLRSVFRFTEERLQYDRAIRIIRNAYGKDSALLVAPYKEIGNSYRASGFEQSRGASALQVALELLQEQEQPDQLMLSQVLLDIGDWKTAFGAVSSGENEYLQAWETLRGVASGEELRLAWFGGRRPVFILTQRMSDRGLSQAPEAVRGSVVVRFDIDHRGRPTNTVIMESQPPGFKDEAALRAIRQSRFRPKMIDGAMVLSRNFGVEITFRYLPAVLEENEETG